MADFSQIEDLAGRLVDDGADSVFLYGSRARGDAFENSDWEIGAVYARERRASRSELARQALESMVIYPFAREDLEAGIAVVPFNQAIWLNELVLTARTVAGQKFIETLPRPAITREDIVADVSFSKGRALDAMIAQRQGHVELAKDLLVKSCLLSLRDFVLLHNLDFPLSYNAIAEQSQSLLPEEYRKLLDDVMSVRKGDLQPTLTMTFDNLGLFSDVIEPKLSKSV